MLHFQDTQLLKWFEVIKVGHRRLSFRPQAFEAVHPRNTAWIGDGNMAAIWPRESDTRASPTVFMTLTANLTAYSETRIYGQCVGTFWGILAQCHHHVVAWQQNRMLYRTT